MKSILLKRYYFYFFAWGIGLTTYAVYIDGEFKSQAYFHSRPIFNLAWFRIF